jgi:serine/threonine protein phosphatase PrpC
MYVLSELIWDVCGVLQNFGSKEDTIFCGVFDGHGPTGHMVAKKVRDSLPLKVSSQWVLNTSAVDRCTEDTNHAGSSEENEDCNSEFFVTLKDSFLKAFKVMDKELKFHPRIDCYCSGTTAVTLVKQVLFAKFATYRRHHTYVFSF